MEIIFAFLILVCIPYLFGSTGRISNRKTTPSGHHKDWKQANEDLTLHGKDYYHKQNLAGKYDIPNNK